MGALCEREYTAMSSGPMPSQKKLDWGIELFTRNGTYTDSGVCIMCDEE